MVTRHSLRYCGLLTSSGRRFAATTGSSVAIFIHCADDPRSSNFEQAHVSWVLSVLGFLLNLLLFHRLVRHKSFISERFLLPGAVIVFKTRSNLSSHSGLKTYYYSPVPVSVCGRNCPFSWLFTGVPCFSTTAH